MTLTFITGNPHKVDEVRKIIPDINQLDFDLDEIQEIDSKKVIEHKLREARKHQSGLIAVEDVSFVLECLNGLPGPLIKWFLKTIGAAGIVKIAEAYGNPKAFAIATVGVMTEDDQVQYFEGRISGSTVPPRGTRGFAFGWDPIFQPDGYETTFAEMTIEQKSAISHRSLAWTKVKEWLHHQDA